MHPGKICLSPNHSISLANGVASCISPVDGGAFQSRLSQKFIGHDGFRNGTLREPAKVGTQQKIGMVVDHMLQHLDQPLDIFAASKWAGVSASSFYLLFKKTTGYTPNNFLIRARMKHACAMLCESSLNVKEVAASLGYHDQFYFSRMFKAVVGVSPRKYRTQTSAHTKTEAGAFRIVFEKNSGAHSSDFQFYAPEEKSM